jgi:hypothetical protein
MKYAPHAIFAVLVATLLIGQRFGFVWAGGNGYVPMLSVFLQDATGPVYADRVGEVRLLRVDDQIYRGETIVTDPATYAQLTISDFPHIITIGMDERTRLTVDSLTVSNPELYLHAGRIETFMDGTVEQLSIRTNFTRTLVGKGRTSLVNYDFKETIGVIPIVGTATVTTTKNDETITISSSVEIHETEPVVVSQIGFDPAASVAKDFYEWIETRFELSPFEIIE